MSYFLAFESSTDLCSVALFKGDFLVDALTAPSGLKHAEVLPEYAQSLIEKNGLSSERLAAVAVNQGPGSYTGLRIGVSMAKAMAYALNIPLLTVCSLQATVLYLIQQCKASFDTNTLFAVMIDARRMDAYVALYNSVGDPIAPVQFMTLTNQSFEKQLASHKVICIGNAAEKYSSLFNEASVNPNLKFVLDVVPNAAHLGPLVNKAFKNKQFANVAYFEPYYLKDFVATVSKKNTAHKPL